MDCQEVRALLVDLLDGAPDEALRRELEQHIVGCADCRREYRLLQRGREALQAALPNLAPQNGYLTAERLERLLAPKADARPRIITFRHFVAAAAAAVILVSGTFLYQDLRSLLGRTHEAPTSAGAAMPPGMPAVRPAVVRVVLTPAPQDGESRVVIGHMVPATDRSGPYSPFAPSYGQVLRTTQEGVATPVRSALYDPEEAGYWW